MAPKFEKYQDYVIKDGKLVGEFEQMYQDFDEPWHQTVREEYSSEKTVGINLMLRLKNQSGIKNVVELGCGFGNYTARIHQLGLNVTGLDISQTAIEKSKKRHSHLNDGAAGKLQFEVAEFGDFEKLKSLKPDVIVMPEITWYILDQLDAFKSFLKKELPDTYLLHMLMTYDPGVQVYGREFFTNLTEMQKYFGMYYLESGLVNLSAGGARTWFLGTWNKEVCNEWNKD